MRTDSYLTARLASYEEWKDRTVHRGRNWMCEYFH